jgi:hypothetical protein
VEFAHSSDASKARYHMNRKMLSGREISVAFAVQTRKRPEEMRRIIGARYTVPSTVFFRTRRRSAYHFIKIEKKRCTVLEEDSDTCPPRVQQNTTPPKVLKILSFEMTLVAALQA